MQYQLELQSKGTRIISGQEAKDRRDILNQLIDIAEINGFNEIILPSIEPAQVYTDKAGPEILNQMYTFKDKGDRDLCLRPEGTATIQLIANKYFRTQKDVKFWYFERCYRYERSQMGRYREFYQFGVEVLNPSSDSIQADLVYMAKQMVETVTRAYETNESAQRGLSYYTAEGFEISCPELGAQQQVVGGGRYKEGIGFAIGFDRLMLLVPDKKLQKERAPFLT